jgi:hypothetical protein
VRAGFLIIVVFGLIYATNVDSLPIQKAPFEGDKETLLNRGALGLMTSVSVFTAGLGSIREAAHGIMIVPLAAEALLGTLLWGLFIVAFSRKVIR